LNKEKRVEAKSPAWKVMTKKFDLMRKRLSGNHPRQHRKGGLKKGNKKLSEEYEEPAQYFRKGYDGKWE